MDFQGLPTGDQQVTKLFAGSIALAAKSLGLEACLLRNLLGFEP